MEKLTSTEALKKITEALDYQTQLFTERMVQGKPQIPFYTEIENVDMVHILSLWKRISSSNKLLFLPGQLEEDRITIIYNPVPGVVIEITSEPCFKLDKKALKKMEINSN